MGTSEWWLQDQIDKQEAMDRMPGDLIEAMNMIYDLSNKTVDLSDEVADLKIQNAKLFKLKYLIISGFISAIFGTIFGYFLSFAK
jgi:hypothetical protein